MSVNFCAQERNIETRSGLEPSRRPVHRTYLHYEKKKKRKKKTTTITTEWNEVNERKTKNEKKLFASSSVCGQLKHLVDCQLDWFLTHDTDQLTLS